MAKHCGSNRCEWIYGTLGKTELKILMSRGTREVAIPLDSLNKDS